MGSYYDIVEGNLRTGDTAKSSDINHIQVHVQDAIKKAISDHHNGESYLLGAGDAHKNDFILTPAPKFLGKYIDSYFIFELDKNNYININHYDVKQPFILTKTSVYSITSRFKNTSNRDIPVDCELQDIDGNVLRRNTITIPAGSEGADLEVVFDLDYYPTVHNLNFKDIVDNDSKEVDVITKEESVDTGFEAEHEAEEEIPEFTAGASILYFVIKRTNLNEFDLDNTNDEQEKPIFDAETSLGVYYSTSSPSAEKKIYAQINKGTIYEETNWNIWLQEIYSNEPTYLCTGGSAVINGEKIQCIDTHVTLAGSNSSGNVLTHVYLGNDGHLYANNSKASSTTNIDKFEEDLDDPDPAVGFRIASILTYSNGLGYDKEPLVIQSEEYGLRNLSHHERLRRLEKRLNWTMDKAIPSRIKYTKSGDDWFDKEGNTLNYPYGEKPEVAEAIGNNYTPSFDSKGNPVIRLTKAVTHTVKVTLKETFKDSNGNPKSIAEDDLLNASILSEIKNMVHNKKNGTLVLDSKAKNDAKTVATTSKGAKETKYNPWDDYNGNRPKGNKLVRHKRKYTVYSGRNDASDRSSHYPAMTFYTKKKIKLKKLYIPITEFENCSGMKFFIYKRQEKNNKKNTVWVETPAKWHSKEMSLKKAKVKNKRQHLDGGFTLTFKGGLSLPKGQYIILCLPIPKGKEGSCFVETYEPKNPKDFCIKYKGNSNASHFRLDDRYPEIWYNSAYAVAEEEDYVKSGHVTSGTIRWTDESLMPISTVKPVLSDNIKWDKGSSFKLYADTGGGFQELKPNEENKMTGSNQSFRWKIEFFSGKSGTPKLSYDKNDGYAIQFLLTRETAGYNNTENLTNYNNKMCLNSVIFDGDKILREYTGDPNLGIEDSKFTQYEFGRIWAEKDQNKNLLIDIQGSDRDMILHDLVVGNNSAKDVKIPYWTYHYCDLKLDDFSQVSVDYDDYTQEVEYDENNLRFKIDPNHSYNDDDITITGLNHFKKQPNDINRDSTDKPTLILANNSEISKNQMLLKNTLEDGRTIDLTKYTGLRFNFKIRSSVSKISLKGLGIYISSSEEDPDKGENNVPSSVREDPEKMILLTDSQALVPEISSEVDYKEYYEGKVIKIIHESTTEDGDKSYPAEYYQYVPQYDSTTGKIVYKLEQWHDYRSYKLYYLPEITYDADSATTEEDSEDKWCEYTARIEIDPDSQNLKYVREIGIISVHDDKRFPFLVSVEGEASSSGSIEIELEDVRAISEDYYPIFNPEKHKFTAEKKATCYGGGELPFVNDSAWTSIYGGKNKPQNLVLKETTPKTSMVSIDFKDLESDSETMLCYFNNTYDLSKYKHIGIQLATDAYVPKDCLKICLCAKPNGQEEITSINVPTLNAVYFPYDSKDSINLSQIFKKIEKDASIKSISIKATKNCHTTLCGDGANNKPIIDTETGGKAKLNLFIGKIVLYKAETIPFFHRRMRYKLYTVNDGEIVYLKDREIDKKDIAIRKIGIVADYK